jgi:hypothetical protein
LLFFLLNDLFSSFLVVCRTALGDEMQRVVLLQLATGWTVDRLYEAELEEFFSTSAPLKDEAALMSLAFFLGFVITTRIAKTALMRTSLQAAPIAFLGPDGKELSPEKRKSFEGLQKAISDRFKTRMQIYDSLVGTRRVLEWSAYGSAWLITGNLLTPW